MKYEEIIEKLKSVLTIEEFAQESLPLDYHNLSPKAKEVKLFRDKWISDNPNPGGGEKYAKWREDLDKIPSHFSIVREDFKVSKNLPNWEEVEQYGGEGMGDTWYSVKYFPEHDIYIKVTGWYQSYNGTEFYDGWGCCSQVRPQQKTITIYE